MSQNVAGALWEDMRNLDHFAIGACPRPCSSGERLDLLELLRHILGCLTSRTTLFGAAAVAMIRAIAHPLFVQTVNRPDCPRQYHKQKNNRRYAHRFLLNHWPKRNNKCEKARNALRLQAMRASSLYAVGASIEMSHKRAFRPPKRPGV